MYLNTHCFTDFAEFTRCRRCISDCAMTSAIGDRFTMPPPTTTQHEPRTSISSAGRLRRSELPYQVMRCESFKANTINAHEMTALVEDGAGGVVAQPRSTVVVNVTQRRLRLMKAITGLSRPVLQLAFYPCGDLIHHNPVPPAFRCLRASSFLVLSCSRRSALHKCNSLISSSPTSYLLCHVY